MDGKDKQDRIAEARVSKGKKNRVAEIRKQRMMSKAELARAAGISPLTIDRVERGFSCRMDTKRKIIRALGLDLSQAFTVFPEEDEPGAPVVAPAPAPLPAPEATPQLTFPIVEPGAPPASPPPGIPNPGVAMPGGVISPRTVMPSAPSAPLSPIVHPPPVVTAPYNPAPASGTTPRTSARSAASPAPKEHRLGEFLTTGNNSSEMQEEVTGEGDVPGAS